MSWTAERLSHLATGYWPAATLNAAVTLGVFDALDAAPASAAAVAEKTDADAARLVSLLDALVAIGLLEKSETTYALSADARPLLARSSPTCLLDAFAYNADLYRQWAGLADVIRGQDPTAGRQQLGGDPSATRRFVRGMEAKAHAFSPAIADTIDLTGVTSLLDVGAGPGTLTRLLAERYARLRPTLSDLPPVLAAAKDLCAASPVADRLQFHAADYRTDPLPAGFDAVLYAGALHQETPASAAALFGKFAKTVKPGGRVVVVDLMLDPTRTLPAFSAMFQLNMLLLRPGSRVFGVEETAALLKTAGFGQLQTSEVLGTPYAIVTGVLAPAPGTPAAG
ncbi:MAG: methyltransferase [Tepidisphaeraceae bacterium]